MSLSRSIVQLLYNVEVVVVTLDGPSALAHLSIDASEVVQGVLLNRLVVELLCDIEVPLVMLVQAQAAV